MRNFIDEHLNIDEAFIQLEKPIVTGVKTLHDQFKGRSCTIKIEKMFSKLIAKYEKNIVNQAPDNPKNEEDACKTIRASEYFPERVIRVRSRRHPFSILSIEEERNSYLKYDPLMIDGQEYTYGYDNARPTLKKT